MSRNAVGPMSATLAALDAWPLTIGFTPTSATVTFSRSTAGSTPTIEFEMDLAPMQHLAASDGRDLHDAIWCLSIERGSPGSKFEQEELIGFGSYSPADAGWSRGDTARLGVFMSESEFDALRAILSGGRLPDRASVGLRSCDLPDVLGNRTWDVANFASVGIKTFGLGFNDIVTPPQNASAESDEATLRRDRLFAAVAGSVVRVEKSLLWIACVCTAIAAAILFK